MDTQSSLPSVDTQRRQALLVLLLGVLVAVAALFVAIRHQQQPIAGAPSALPSVDGFPVLTVQGIDNSDARPEAGYPAPAFVFHLADGSTVDLRDYRGRPVILNFWATWCPPCRQEMPDLVRLYQAHKDEGLVILEINEAESEDAVRAFVQELPLPMPILLDSRGEVLDVYKSQSLPTSIFIDRQGVIRVRWLGYMNADLMEENAQKIL